MGEGGSGVGAWVPSHDGVHTQAMVYAPVQSCLGQSCVYEATFRVSIYYWLRIKALSELPEPTSGQWKYGCNSDLRCKTNKTEAAPGQASSCDSDDSDGDSNDDADSSIDADSSLVPVPLV